MSEVEKLYELAGIKKQVEGYCDWDCDCPYTDVEDISCSDRCPYWKYEEEAKYPPFTAEKQLKLIKWLAQNKGISINYDDRYFEWGMATDFYGGHFFDDFDECLADLVNVIWQDLTESEKAEIKRILE